MTIGPQRGVERLLDIRCAAFHVQHHAVGIRADYGKAVAFRKLHYRLVILFRRAEARSEFLRREESVKVGAVRIVKLLEKLIQHYLVAQRQTDGKRKNIGRRQTPLRRQPSHHPRHMAGQRHSLRFGLCVLGRCQCEQQSQEQIAPLSSGRAP